MNGSITFDFYVWKYLVPRIQASFFKSKIISFLALVYISFFRLPGKYIWHYFKGEEKTLQIDTKNVILSNSAVYEKVMYDLELLLIRNMNGGELQIGQILVNNPNYKYSIGSFNLFFQKEAENIFVKIESDYCFSKNNQRVTSHLHKWLHSYKEKGMASNFKIEGNTWKTNYNELKNLETDKRTKKYDRLNILNV